MQFYMRPFFYDNLAQILHGGTNGAQETVCSKPYILT
jgi:hypothetical protein